MASLLRELPWIMNGFNEASIKHHLSIRNEVNYSVLESFLHSFENHLIINVKKQKNEETYFQ